MKRIKSILASALMGLVVLAGFGFGIMAVGFAIIIGGAFALALRLAGPRLMAEAEKRTQSMQDEVGTTEPQPA